MKRLVLVLAMVFGVSGFAQATLMVTGMGENLSTGLSYKLIYDDDYDITWYDYTYDSTGWGDAVGLGGWLGSGIWRRHL